MPEKLRRGLFIFFNHLPYFDDFIIFNCEHKKFILELKESLLLMRDQPCLKKIITSALLYVIDRP